MMLFDVGLNCFRFNNYCDPPLLVRALDQVILVLIQRPSSWRCARQHRWSPNPMMIIQHIIRQRKKHATSSSLLSPDSNRRSSRRSDSLPSTVSPAGPSPAAASPTLREVHETVETPRAGGAAVITRDAVSRAKTITNSMRGTTYDKEGSSSSPTRYDEEEGLMAGTASSSTPGKKNKEEKLKTNSTTALFVEHATMIGDDHGEAKYATSVLDDPSQREEDERPPSRMVRNSLPTRA